jgi:hypothetical protein
MRPSTGPRPSGRGWAALLSLALSAAPLAAQADEQLWRFVDAKGGFCLWYLADPAVAPTLVPAGITLRPASATAALPDVLLRLVQDEPRFAEWIPGMLCAGLYGAVAADGNPVGTARPDRPLVLTISALAAASPYGQDAGWYLSSVGVRAGSLDRVAERGWIAVREPEYRVRSGIEGEEDQWELQLDGLRLAWSGHPSGEPRVGSTRTMSFGYAGNRNSTWLVEFRAAPEGERNQVGSLRVEGRNPLATALKSSPIRTIGPLPSGGELTMMFRRLVPVSR